MPEQFVQPPASFRYERNPESIFNWQLEEYVLQLQRISNTSPDTKDMAPTLHELLALIQSRPDFRRESERTLARLAQRIEYEPYDHGLVEMLEFLMATLRWSSVREVLQQVVRSGRHRHQEGSGRGYDSWNMAERVLRAFDDD